MIEASIPVDLFNPGQVFACLGFLEAADVLLGDAEGAFDWRDDEVIYFHLRVAGEHSPFAAVLEFLATAEVTSTALPTSKQNTAKWNVPTISVSDGDPFPFPDPPSPATLPAMLKAANCRPLIIDHWGDKTDRDNIKFWAGSGGYPGSALLRDALDLVRDRMSDAATDPFSLSAPQSSSFRFDWRRDYIPMEVGFSPNDHRELTMVGFPLVEILAAIGLENARPQRLDKLNYLYGVLGTSSANSLFNPIFLRASLGAVALPFPQRVFCMRLGWPGQVNQARCITNVIEGNKS